MTQLDPIDVEQMRSSSDVGGLIGALHSDQPSRVRWAAAKALGQVKNPESVPALIAGLDDGESCVRSAAAEALGKLGGTDAEKALLAALGDGVGLVRQAAVEALRSAGHPGVDQALVGALRDDFVDVRLAAASALGERRCEQAVEPLIILLLATETFERKVASQALAQIGAPAVGLLIDALTDRQWLIREYAASILGAIGDERAVEPLIAALKDREAVVREIASRSLGAIGSKAGNADLRVHIRESLNATALEDTDHTVREVAQAAHQQIQPS